MISLPVVASAVAVTLLTASPASAAPEWDVGESDPVGVGNSWWSSVSTTVQGKSQTWALGAEMADTDDGTTMLARGTGTNLKKMELPSEVSDLGSFELDAVSAENVWLIGEDQPDASDKTVMRYDGSSWKDVTPPGGAYGETVSASGSRGWALTGEKKAAYRTHGAWHTTRVTSSGTVTNLDAWARDDVWAAGNDDGKPAIWHYDGKKWAKQKLPKVPGCGSAMIDAPARDTAFAYCQVSKMEGPDDENVKFVGLKWTGSKWAKAGEQANRKQTTTDLTSSADGQAWVSSGAEKVWHYNGDKWVTEKVEQPEGDITPDATTSSVSALRDKSDVVAVGHLEWLDDNGAAPADQIWSREGYL